MHCSSMPTILAAATMCTALGTATHVSNTDMDLTMLYILVASLAVNSSATQPVCCQQHSIVPAAMGDVIL